MVSLILGSAIASTIIASSLFIYPTTNHLSLFLKFLKYCLSCYLDTLGKAGGPEINKLVLILLLGCAAGVLLSACSYLDNPEQDNPEFGKGVDDPDNWNVHNYEKRMLTAFEDVNSEVELCNPARDQRCKTESLKNFRDNIGLSVPISASWISAAHKELSDALNEMVRINELAAAGVPSSEWNEELGTAGQRLTEAMSEWFRQMEKGH